ncbi:hypothetical protein CLG96_17390 [Sphingomonas oleivorans]|uniref:Copper chaperone PCu(A)C n=1 Tax=Sphingomonas oleivorans TaxID=1735121 RepID=A0A2T5FTD8_9SPHN|nr:copper chaperone PCu(A)C [Sphingomonas oleivorans]PTQ07328.1 hypothetical protein CLG96_17390 [Sphingomonas oleivorans]
MKYVAHRLALAATLSALALGACGRQDAGQLAVRDAWVRLPAVAGRPAAAYFTLKGGSAADRLTGIQSAVVERIELHAGGAKDGMTTMRPIEGVDIAAGGTVEFAPGGNHAMLFGIDKAIRPGTAIPMNFRFASGKAVEVEARTVAAGDEAPVGHEGH